MPDPDFDIIARLRASSAELGAAVTSLREGRNQDAGRNLATVAACMLDASEEIARQQEGYRLLAYALCRLKGLIPEEGISDAGHEAWQLAAYEAIQEELARNA